MVSNIFNVIGASKKTVYYGIHGLIKYKTTSCTVVLYLSEAL